jgi:hypothetical protein
MTSMGLQHAPSVVRAGSVAAALALSLAAIPSAGVQEPQLPPSFQSSVDLQVVDVQVSGSDEVAIADLTKEQFELTFNGRPRPVALAQFLHRDAGQVVRRFDRQLDPAVRAACVFGFERRTDKPTAHYLLGMTTPIAGTDDFKSLRISVTVKGMKAETWVARIHVKK